MKKLASLFVLANLVAFTFNGCMDDAMVAQDNTTGVAGSLARFAIVGNYLYAVNFSKLNVYDISNPSDPVFISETIVTNGVETIFPFAGKLFIGTQMGVFIYDLQPNGTPVFLSTYEHVVSCDPVTTNGQYAYVTLRTSQNCRQEGINQLDILNISDIANPVLVSSWQMNSPIGVGVDNNTLFVCEGTFGLKVFDVTDPYDIVLKNQLTNIQPHDVIVLGNQRLLLVAPDNLYQIDYSDLNNLQIISQIPIEA